MDLSDKEHPLDWSPATIFVVGLGILLGVCALAVWGLMTLDSANTPSTDSTVERVIPDSLMQVVEVDTASAWFYETLGNPLPDSLMPVVEVRTDTLSECERSVWRMVRAGVRKSGMVSHEQDPGSATTTSTIKIDRRTYTVFTGGTPKHPSLTVLDSPHSRLATTLGGEVYRGAIATLHHWFLPTAPQDTCER